MIKSSKNKEPRLCPICGLPLIINYPILDCYNNDTNWFLCKCGCIVNLNKRVDKTFFNEEYRKVYQSLKQVKERNKYFMDMYLPLIEEMTYGRKFLDIGFCEPYNIDMLTEKGWISTGIDLMDNKYIKADFEDYTPEPYENYDFIYMGGILESFNFPVQALEKSYKLLRNEGCLLVTTPCADSIFISGIKKFGHWNGKSALMFFSKRKILEILEKIGYNIVVVRENYGQRFLNWNNLHILVQKFDKDIEEPAKVIPPVKEDASSGEVKSISTT